MGRGTRPPASVSWVTQHEPDGFQQQRPVLPSPGGQDSPASPTPGLWGVLPALPGSGPRRFEEGLSSLRLCLPAHSLLFSASLRSPSPLPPGHWPLHMGPAKPRMASWRILKSMMPAKPSAPEEPHAQAPGRGLGLSFRGKPSPTGTCGLAPSAPAGCSPRSPQPLAAKWLRADVASPWRLPARCSARA